ncbi:MULTISPECIES: HTH domain-containing protein [unclassified Tolypothrix]|nr:MULTISPECIES: HTH domain-containing protein [unclassified Tolypothrix]EKF04374.1 TetR/AcrR family transcriptional regulator [Tolypothrix sp. PCC 7601]MBE9081019.1 HTH domain-containing protein [Tolypothrix sp. LEGE 11397]UYD24915.1 HTH domain-containing protein [Tolypothrix sp. PCC 7712]UYD32852.1 HTH domain-containing protein [Tolypothrix sp. PCC 7601]
MILLDLEPIKSDISISALSEEIGISRTTIYKYKDLAEYILDFERDLPQL